MKMIRNTMKNIWLVLALAALGFAPTTHAQPHLDWARTGSTSYGAIGLAVAVSGESNVFSTGRFYGNVDFGTTNLAAQNFGSWNGFVARYFSDSTLQWVRRLGSDSYAEARAVAADASGRSYVGGFHHGTMFLDVTNFSPMGGQDGFLAAYETNGTVRWALRFAGGSTDNVNGLAMDAAGNIFVAGQFSGTVDFGGTNLTSSGSQDAFVAKVSPDGMVQWVRRFGDQSLSAANAIALGIDGTITIAGSFYTVIHFGEHCLTGRGDSDMFVARLDADGNVLWAQSGGGTSTEVGQSVAVDRDGHTYVSGYFYGNPTFSSTNLNGVGGQDGFLCRYEANGSLTWSRLVAGNSHDDIRSLALDSAGNPHVSGATQSSPLNLGVTNLFTQGGWDAFAAKFDTNGNVRWAVKVGYNNDEIGHGLVLDVAGNIYMAGQFGGTAFIGPTNIYNPSGQGFFLTRWLRDLPVITAQPQSQILMEGSVLALSVTATGTGPISVQWQFNGTNLPGATQTTLLYTNITTARSGTYQAIVSNEEGSVSSDTAQVTVLTLAEAADSIGLSWTTGGNTPWINQTNASFDGVDALRSGMITNSQQSWLETRVVGPARVSFYWKISSENGYDFLRFSINGVEVTNTSGKVEWKLLSFLLPAGTNTLRWLYMKDESESVGQDAGWVDAVNVVYAPAFFTGPASQVVTQGSPVVFGSTLTGSAPFDFQWRHDGTNVPGATNGALTILNVQTNDAGAYALVASNAAGVAVSAPATLTVLVPPVITQQPVSQSASPGGTVRLTVAGTGVAPLTFQWLLNGTNLPWVTEATLIITNIGPSQAGRYSVVVSSPSGSTLSEMAVVTVNELVMRPTITIHGAVGHPYRIDFKNNAAQPNWMTLTNLILPSSPWHHVDFTAEGQPRRFYRVVAE